MCGCKHCAAGLPHNTITPSDRRMTHIFNRRYPAYQIRRRLVTYDRPGDIEPPPPAADNTRQPWTPRAVSSRHIAA